MNRFLSIITASEAIGENWQADLRRRLEEWELTLMSGDIMIAGERCGPYTFHGIDEVRGRFGDAPWLKASCPQVGRALGAISWERRESYGCADKYFSVEHWTALYPPLRELLVPLMKEARGVVVRVPDGAYREPVRLRSYELRYAIGKYGCDDGAELLTREDGDYARDVLARIEAALRSKGLSGYVGWMPTCHNPIRFSEVEVRGVSGTESRAALWRGDENCQPVEDADAALADSGVELWTYDFAMSEDLAFFANDE